MMSWETRRVSPLCRRTIRSSLGVLVAQTDLDLAPECQIFLLLRTDRISWNVRYLQGAGCSSGRCRSRLSCADGLHTSAREPCSASVDEGFFLLFLIGFCQTWGRFHLSLIGKLSQSACFSCSLFAFWLHSLLADDVRCRLLAGFVRTSCCRPFSNLRGTTGRLWTWGEVFLETWWADWVRPLPYLSPTFICFLTPQLNRPITVLLRFLLQSLKIIESFLCQSNEFIFEMKIV